MFETLLSSVPTVFKNFPCSNVLISIKDVSIFVYCLKVIRMFVFFVEISTILKRTLNNQTNLQCQPQKNESAVMPEGGDSDLIVK